MSYMYGNQIIPNNVSSVYFFDITYNNDELSDESVRKTKAAEDGVLIGRYALSRKVAVNGSSLTINKVYRKVATSDSIDYEQVAVLDAAPPTFSAAASNIGADWFSPSSSFDGDLETIAGQSKITISANPTRDYTKVDSPYEHQIDINLPVLGAMVGEMNNVLYGTTNRAEILASAGELIGNAGANGRTIEKDGVIGVIGHLDWDALNNSSLGQAAAKYVKINNGASDSIDKDFLALAGGNMKGAIGWADTDFSISATTNFLSIGKNNSRISIGADNSISLSASNGITLNAATVTAAPTQDNSVSKYGTIKRLVDTTGKPYILSSSDVSGAGQASITITNDAYKNLPENTIIFIPVS